MTTHPQNAPGRSPDWTKVLFTVSVTIFLKLMTENSDNLNVR